MSRDRFRLPAAGAIARAAFVCSNLVILWTGFRTNSVLFLIVAVGFAVYAVWFHYAAKRPAAEFGWREISWLLPWFGGMWLLSALSDIGGGAAVLGFWPDVVLTALWSLVVIEIAQRCALVAQDTAAVMAHMADVPSVGLR